MTTKLFSAVSTLTLICCFIHSRPAEACQTFGIAFTNQTGAVSDGDATGNRSCSANRLTGDISVNVNAFGVANFPSFRSCNESIIQNFVVMPSAVLVKTTSRLTTTFLVRAWTFTGVYARASAGASITLSSPAAGSSSAAISLFVAEAPLSWMFPDSGFRTVSNDLATSKSRATTQFTETWSVALGLGVDSQAIMPSATAHAEVSTRVQTVTVCQFDSLGRDLVP